MKESSYDRITNSRFYSLGDKLGDIIMLSFFWLICSLPIVTMGPATCALYFAMHKRFADKSETPVRDYWRSFKGNLGQGIVLNIILLLYAGVTGFNIFVAWKGFNGIKLPDWYLPVAILLVLPLVFCVPYVFPYLARFKNSTKNTLFHSFTFATMYAGHTLLMWLFMILSLAVMIAFFPSMLFMPFVCCYLCRRLIERDFGFALLQKEKREHPERFREEEDEDDEEEYYEEYEIDEEDDEESDDESEIEEETPSDDEEPSKEEES
ncbi:MAG: YesL family protein [Clostridiales bacterium]|nr:YesL family protein [Clostridiales bacterium]